MTTPKTGNLILDAISDGGAGDESGSTEAVATSSSAGGIGPTDDTDSDDSDEGTDTESGDLTGTAGSKAPADSKSAPASSKAQSASTKEVLELTDETGRKRRYEVDYSDRAAIKKAFEMAHGARKWQSDRDRAIASEKALREKAEKDSRILNALEKAYEEAGEEGVLDLIAGKPGASQQWIQRKIERHKFMESASPQEIAALERDERLAKLERELSRSKEESASREKRIAEEREAAQVSELQSQVNPLFEKYRFDGKLGDAEDEALFDETLWNTAMARLKPYEEKGVQITRELVDSAFRETAARLRKRLGGVAEKKVAATVEKKKQEATEAAQTATSNAYARGGARAEAEGLLASGNFKSLLSNWGKYGSSFSRKK
jgi:hypothetical protein